MKVLAFSDIHHNLVAVRKLRAFQSNSFDAIIVAGDIGNEAAVEFFKILSSFKCPILYVFGNWDHSLSYRKKFWPKYSLGPFERYPNWQSKFHWLQRMPHKLGSKPN